MSAPASDRQLLFAALALQMEFVGREQLSAALKAWAQDRSRPLADVLAEQGALSAEDREALERLVERHLARHDQDASKSLAALPATPQLLHTINTLSEGDGVLPSAAPAAVTGTGAARFRVLKRHATGGLGEVSVALDEQLGREVALKQLHRHADDADSRSRFLREAEITGRLEHPGIVPVYGLDSDEQGRPRYAMRFIHGDSLEDAVKRFHAADAPRRDPTERALTLRGLLSRFVDVCNAVAYAHSRGVIHRDLKPANVMLGEFGETLVVDWGLARVLDEDEGRTQPHRAVHTLLDSGTAPTQLGQVVGTPAYMPPEQARGENARVGVGSDVYALGGTLYCLLTGHPPHPGPSSEALIHAGKGEVRPARQVNPRVPRALEAVCRKAMAPRPEDRYPNARELAGEVERWLADEPVGAYRDPLRARMRRWAKRNRTLVSAAVALLLAGVAGLSLGLWAVNRERAATARQRDEARDNLVRALKAEEQANRSLRQAEANLKLARRAIDDCYNTATKDPLFQQPRMESPKRLLLALTLPFYKNFRLQRPDDRELQRAEAEQWYRVASIEQVLVRTREAKEAYEQARDLQIKLVKAHPDVPVYRNDLARTYNNLGNLLAGLGQREEALGQYSQARDLQIKLVKAHPNVPEFQNDLAGSHNNLGILLAGLGKREEALEEYQRACQLHHRLVKTYPTEAAYQNDLANAHNNRAFLLDGLGKREEALEEYQRACRLQLQLVKACPTVREYQNDLARTHNNQGNLLAGLGKRPEALQEYQQARDLRLTLVKSHPDLPEYQKDLAATHNNLGVLLRALGQREEALKEYQQARDLQKKLVEAHPDIPGYKSELATTHANQGNLLSDLGKGEEALKAYERARDLQSQLAKAHPDVPGYADDLTRTCFNRGALLVQANRHAEALADLGEAIAQTDRLRRLDPKNPMIGPFLLFGLPRRAAVLEKLGRPRDSDADWERVLKIAPAPQRPALRLQRADSRVRAGDYRRAAAEAEQLALAEGVPGATLYDLACVFALSARHAGNDAARPLPEREKRAEGHAREALALLKRAAAAGLFADPKHVRHARQDEDLDALRDRDDFKGFLAGLEKQP